MSHLAKVSAVAEPRDDYRQSFAATHKLAPEAVFHSWQEFVDRPKMCDAVVISTMDRDHAGPAVACLNKGYHVLLEKPMAISLEDCRAIEAAQRQAGTVVAVCHSLRYNKGFSLLKEIVDSMDKRGQIISCMIK
jgi:predicted dehydrogenase